MRCEYCRRENPDNKIFCIECGERLYTNKLIEFVRSMDDEKYDAIVNLFILSEDK